jgi:FlaA1/EpsC-like NDP-sugar epimerase
MTTEAAELLRSARTRRRKGSSQTGAAGVIPEGLASGVVLRRDQVYRRLLATADVAAAALAIAFAALYLGPNRIHATALVALPGAILISKIVGLYDRDEHLLRKTTLDEAPELFQVASIYTLLLWLGGDVFVSGDLGRWQVLGLWMLLFLAMMVGRTVCRRVARQLTAEERCLVIGDAMSSQRLPLSSAGCR